MYQLKLTQEEINLLIEVLLFSFGVDISAYWDFEKENEMFQLAKKLKEVSDNNIQLKNIYIFEAIFDNPDRVKKIVEFFPNIKNK